jgi:hypothetical protein
MGTGEKPTSPQTNYVLGRLIMYKITQTHADVSDEQEINQIL